ncbi:MAG: hypothetical protein ACOC97_02590 [Myxococcota bacterium]
MGFRHKLWGALAAAAVILGAQEAQAQLVEEEEYDEEVEMEGDRAVEREVERRQEYRRAHHDEHDEHDDGGVGIAFQGRLIVNFFNFAGGLQLQPAIAPGLRLGDRVFLGLGVYIFGIQNDVHGVAGTPTMTIDLAKHEWASFHVVGWVPVGTIIQEPEGGGDNVTAPFIGANVGLGVKGKISDGISIGVEWGWGFSFFFEADDTELFDRDTDFVHSAFGSVLFEAAIGM